MKKRFDVRIDEKLLERVKEVASENDLTVTSLIEMSLRLFLVLSAKRNRDDHDVEQI